MSASPNATPPAQQQFWKAHDTGGSRPPVPASTQDSLDLVGCGGIVGVLRNNVPTKRAASHNRSCGVRCASFVFVEMWNMLNRSSLRSSMVRSSASPASASPAYAFCVSCVVQLRVCASAACWSLARCVGDAFLQVTFLAFNFSLSCLLCGPMWRSFLAWSSRRTWPSVSCCSVELFKCS